MNKYLQERMKKAQGDEGFTLIELLVVIIILGILTAVVVFSVQGLTDRGQPAACKTDKRILETAQEAYYSQQAVGDYATEAELLAANLIDAESELHDVTPADPTTAYDVVPEAGGPC